jgi:hypothetical protein
MSSTEESSARAAATGGGDQKGRIPKALIILPSTFPANTWMFFRQINSKTLVDRYIHWIKLPQLGKEIPVPCMATAKQHADLSSWTVPDTCPMCKWAVDKDPRQVVNRYSPDKPNIQHQWSFKVNPLVPRRGPDGKITGLDINPNVHLLQITQATLFKAITAAKDDPELPSIPPLEQRALKLFRGLEAGKEAKDTKYQAVYSANVLGTLPEMVDAIPSEDDLEKVWTQEEFMNFLNLKPKDDKAPAQEQGQQGQQAPAGGAAGAAKVPPVTTDDAEF